MAQRPSVKRKKGTILVFSSTSGGGKTTLINHCQKTFPNLVYSVSATTRIPRKGEKDGVHYFFMTVKEFEKAIESDAFAEWAVVHDHYYGTPRSFIDDVVSSGKHIIMDIDVVGKIQFDKVYPDAIGILVLPPSLKVLEKRLRARGSDSKKAIETRLDNARKEINFAYAQGKYEHTIINDDLAKAKKEIVEIVRRHTGMKPKQ